MNAIVPNAMNSSAWYDYTKSPAYAAACAALVPLAVKMFALEAADGSNALAAVPQVVTAADIEFLVNELVCVGHGIEWNHPGFEALRAYGTAFGACQVDHWHRTVMHTASARAFKAGVEGVARGFTNGD